NRLVPDLPAARRHPVRAAARPFRKAVSEFMDISAPYVAPLCPAGHLPHEGGDRPSSLSAPILKRWRLAKVDARVDLPPRGGDVRQDRGGREGTRPFRCNTNLSARP